MKLFIYILVIKNNQPINVPTNQPNNYSSNQPTKQSTIHPICHHINHVCVSATACPWDVKLYPINHQPQKGFKDWFLYTNLQHVY